MNQGSVILLIIGVALFIIGFLKYRKFHKLANEEQARLLQYTAEAKIVKDDYYQKIVDLKTIQLQKENLLAEKEKAAIEAITIQERNKAAIDKTKEEVKAEYATLKMELSKTCETELQALRLQHDTWMQEHANEFLEYTTHLDKLRKSIEITEKKKKDEAMMEDFIATHSLAITIKDYEDINTLTECRNRLNRKSVLDSLVWSEFVQGPLQQLRKELVSVKLTEKISGIYRITNIENDRCYIGQAVDIGGRWTEHIKAALNSPTDKFHKALAQAPLYSWTWEILEKCGKPQLNEREKYWITHYKSNEFGYNTTGGNK